MQILPSVHPHDLPGDPAELRRRFLLGELFQSGRTELAYWEVDRTVIGGAVPTTEALDLMAPGLLGSGSFCARRELGIINLGGSGEIVVDGQSFEMAPRDGLYVGRGAEQVTFTSRAAGTPARYYLLSYPAHASYPVKHVAHANVTPVELGAPETSNRRTLYKYFAPGVVETCQLTMGLTALATGSVWNTLPPHTHLRRSEVYCYCELVDENAVIHLMGEPAATRHLVMRNLEVVVSPSWSIHAGAGTSNYAFVWGMGGENQDFADMNPAPIASLY